MTTTYPGREDEHDLGGGHSFAWAYAGDAATRLLLGLVEHHPDLRVPEAQRGEVTCGAYAAWVHHEPTRTVARHELVAGGVGDEEHLTLTPSLLCPTCGNHGFIRDGRWVVA